MTELIIQTGKHQGKKIDLAGNDCIIGRHESCKIRVASGDVSKQHCRLKHKDGQLHAKDLGSRNGTFVNDQPLDKEVVLKAGDLLRVGPMTFLIAEGKPVPVASAAVQTSPTPAQTRPSSSHADDDLIAAWLSEGGDIEKSGQDTTVIGPSSAKNSIGKDTTAEVQTDAAEDVSLKSVRERAKDVIRRWQKENGKG